MKLERHQNGYWIKEGDTLHGFVYRDHGSRQWRAFTSRSEHLPRVAELGRELETKRFKTRAEALSELLYVNA